MSFTVISGSGPELLGIEKKQQEKGNGNERTGTRRRGSKFHCLQKIPKS